MAKKRPTDEDPSARAARVAAAAKKSLAKRAVKVEPPARTKKATITEPELLPASSIESGTEEAADDGRGVPRAARPSKSQAADRQTNADSQRGRTDRLHEAIELLTKRIEQMVMLEEAGQVRFRAQPQTNAQRIVIQRAWSGAVVPITAAIQHVTHGPMVIVIAQPTDLESMAADLSSVTLHPIIVFPQASDDGQTETILQNEVLQRLQVLSTLQRFSQGVSDPRNPHKLPPIILTTLPAIMHGVPAPSELGKGRRVLSVNDVASMNDLREWLTAAGYVSTTAVQYAGEFTVRGGILDVYPPDSADPVRLEWFDDEIESIRTFDAVTQRSIERLDHISLSTTSPVEMQAATLLDYLPQNSCICQYEPSQIVHFGQAFIERVPFPQRYHNVENVTSVLRGFASIDFVELAELDEQSPIVDCPLGDVQRIAGDLEQLSKRIDDALANNRTGVVVCINEPEMARMQELFSENVAYRERRLSVQTALLSQGFELHDGGPIVLTVTQLLKRTALPRSTRKAHSRAIDSFLDLRSGDYVVHLSHGIGIYRGLQLIERLGQKHEHLEIEFAEGTKVYVPTTKIELVQRYIGGTKSQPKLAKIGSATWVRQKQAAQEAVVDMAADLLELQAQRRSQPGISFAGDTVWQSQFEGSFPYEETPDQITAVAATKADMMQPRPMDRLICGDVGFGKTEVAMRAAFKAVDSGYQVAVLVPTTVLAEQHYKTFCQRMADFPFDIARLSRFCSTTEEREIVRRITAGQIDIVIGTSRIVSSDIQWFNLGLVIVDEEQRFGVAMKERLKLQRPNVDLMTLSATPIPRTLHMSLLGVRDISNLETAPQERLSVETKVIRFDEKLVRNAILRELNRGGQIYFVHNRVQDMPVMVSRLQRIVPEARIVVGHGQMPEHELERVMVDFIEHRYDILLATTIIESGLDIPNANTIFIDEADHYGLSELHQLRGRVGRYKHQAYCYLLIDKHKHLNPDAARRMHAIEEYSQIGAGFGIAMRDLEIRGAGNLLGTQQSGHIAAVGYELYCQLLENAVRHLKHQPPKLTIDVEVNLPIEAFIASDYVPEMRHKIDLYRRLSRVDDVQMLGDLRQELEDRFGKIPRETDRLFRVAQLRIDATLWSVRYIGIEDEFMVFTYADHRRMEQLARRQSGRLRLIAGQKAYWPLEEEPADLLTIAASVLQP